MRLIDSALSFLHFSHSNFFVSFRVLVQGAPRNKARLMTRIVLFIAGCSLLGAALLLSPQGVGAQDLMPVAGDGTPVAGLPQEMETVQEDSTLHEEPLDRGGEREEDHDTATSVEADTPVPKDTLGTKEDYPRFTPEEYRYAEAPRYTLTGQLPYRESHPSLVPTLITGASVAGIIAAIHIYQQNAWWANRREPFHFDVDWGYAAQADKFGHFYAGYLTSYVGYESLIASGFSPEVAGWLGPLLGFGFQTYVEVEDGFSPFGFDPTDQVANTLGPLIFGLQNYVPALQNFKFKWEYWPDDEYEEGVRSGHDEIIIDDYNSQSVWLSFKMGNILPESLGWPKWLRLAVGYGTYNVDRFDEEDRLLTPGRRLYVSLDYDLVEMLPDLGTFGNWIVQTADYLRWPAPTLQIEPEVKFYLLWPVRF